MKKLSEIATIRSGYYEKLPQGTGMIAYLQVKHIDPKTGETSVIDTYLNETKGAEGHLLKEGDVLFAAKGTRNYAWVYNETTGQAVASTAFLILRPDTNKILSDFLVMVLNHPSVQSQFQQLMAGSSTPSIRKQDMEDLMIPTPVLIIQEDTVRLHKAMVEDRILTNQLLVEKEKLMQAVIKKVIQEI